MKPSSLVCARNQCILVASLYEFLRENKYDFQRLEIFYLTIFSINVKNQTSSSNLQCHKQNSRKYSIKIETIEGFQSVNGNGRAGTKEGQLSSSTEWPVFTLLCTRYTLLQETHLLPLSSDDIYIFCSSVGSQKYIFQFAIRHPYPPLHNGNEKQACQNPAQKCSFP